MAILLIMVLHFYNEAFMKDFHPVAGPVLTKLALSGMWGVDLFLLLSGYLITMILLDGKGQQGYFLNFYVRRALRIFPLYYGTLFVVFQIVPLVSTLDAVAVELTARQWWLWLFLSNVPGGPLLDGSRLYSLGHLWMLAMQIHFYLLWPFAVAALSQRRLIQVCIGSMIIGFTARTAVALLGVGSESMFRWSTITRIDGLAAGSILAVLVRNPEVHLQLINLARHGIRAFGCLFLVMVFIPRSFYHDTAVVFEVPVVVLFVSSLLVLALRPSPPSNLFVLFSNRFLVSLGKYSYGLFVIHGILRPVLERLIPLDRLVVLAGLPVMAMGFYIILAIAISFLLSFVVWHLFEKHFLRLKKFFVLRPVLS